MYGCFTIYSFLNRTADYRTGCRLASFRHPLPGCVQARIGLAPPADGGQETRLIVSGRFVSLNDCQGYLIVSGSAWMQ